MTNEKLNTIGDLFVSEVPAAANAGHALSNTARLTSLSTDIANKIMLVVNSDVETYKPQFLASQKSHDAMDDLIAECYEPGLGSVEIDFLEVLGEEELERMIRSQQSKRSRSKSKVMTKENYMTMMVGAVAENLLRLAAGKPKNSGGGAVMGDIGFSDEDIAKLEQFPDELKKAIRNVQSKKSIMRSKADFDEESPRWIQLLQAEQQLKEARDRVNGLVNEEAQKALEVKNELEEMLSTTDGKELTPDEAADLLDKMKEMLASK